MCENLNDNCEINTIFIYKGSQQSKQLILPEKSCTSFEVQFADWKVLYCQGMRPKVKLSMRDQEIMIDLFLYLWKIIWALFDNRVCVVTVCMDTIWVFLSSVKRWFYPPFFPKEDQTTPLLPPWEPVRFGASFAEELGVCRAALGDEQEGARVEVVKRVDTIEGGAEGRHREDGDGREPPPWFLLQTPSSISSSRPRSLTFSATHHGCLGFLVLTLALAFALFLFLGFPLFVSA